MTNPITIVCDRLWKISRLNLKTPITLIMDNARYQYGHLVIAFAKQLNIELEFLPSYSPNLNLIERLWKFVKTESETMPVLKILFEICLFLKCHHRLFKQTASMHKNDLDSLLTLKFQTFSSADGSAPVSTV